MLKNNILKKSKRLEPTSFQDWLGINDILDNKIVFKDNTCVHIIKVLPINFKLKSELEQNAILLQYKNFLTNINSQIQIIISSHKTDISSHIEKISKITNENLPIKDAIYDYIDLVKSIVDKKGAISKDFYLAIKETENTENEIMKMKEYLLGCGNEVEDCSKKEVELLIKSYINKRLLNIEGGLH